MPLFCVEWLAVDVEGNAYHLCSHSMPRRDAQAMAETLAAGNATAVEVIPLNELEPIQ